jgi:hypothetical protein
MRKLLKWELLSIAFIATIIVFGTSLVFLAVLDISSKAKIIFVIFAIASFFSSLSLILQIKEKRRNESRND